VAIYKAMDARLNLEEAIRPQLARMEDSLMFDLFERAQFKVNDAIYTIDGVRVTDPNPSNPSDYFPIQTPSDVKLCFLDFMLKGTEELYAKAGRFNQPGEVSFFDGLPKPIVIRNYDKSPVKDLGLNFNQKIKGEYLRAVRFFCSPGDDGQYGSSVVLDIRALDDLSRRIHYGTYVAEAKFQQNPELYRNLIANKNRAEIERQLTDEEVERAVIQRVEEKGQRYGVSPRFISAFYKDKIIPLTKEVEVEYLIRRGTD
jgi:chorismate mutase